jgi:hypothetical protein
MWHLQQSTETFVAGLCADCYSNTFSASVVYRSTNQDGGLFMLISLAMLYKTLIIQGVS